MKMTPRELNQQLHGVCVISITPFKEDGAFDAKGYEKNLRFIMDHGLNKSNATIVVGGSTGECGAMNTAERKEVLECALAVCGDALPVIAGCNSTNVRESIELAQHAEAHGAVGVMALSPYYYPAKDEECIYQFYKALSENTGLGILLYNNFEVMQIDCPIPVLKRLKDDFPNVVGMKECTPAFFKMTRVVQEIGDKVSVVNGHGEFLEPYAAMAGTAGFISSMSNFAPEKAVAIWEARSTGDYAKAKAIRDTMVPYMDLACKYSAMGGEYKVISLLKYITDLVGSCGGYPRIPCVPLTEEEKAEVRQVLAQLDL
ncbi:dihydrodipicolinate synthase family protein [Ruthenibacterium lactatiformans]